MVKFLSFFCMEKSLSLSLLFGKHLDMSIQTTLKTFLQDRNMTQAQFAELAGLNPCGLSKFLNREDGESIAERVYPYLHEFKEIIATPNTPTEPAAKEVAHELA